MAFSFVEIEQDHDGVKGAKRWEFESRRFSYFIKKSPDHPMYKLLIQDPNEDPEWPVAEKFYSFEQALERAIQWYEKGN